MSKLNIIEKTDQLLVLISGVNKSVNNHLQLLGMSTKVHIMTGFVNKSVNRSVA
jgi:hypothetical protein